MMLVESRTTVLGCLPNEIIMTILSKLSTLELLPITPTSHRIHSIIVRILHNRLLIASSLPEHKLVFECFHPSTKMSTPYLLCDFISTSPLPSLASDSDSKSKAKEVEKEMTLGDLHNFYSHFRPLKPEDDNRTPRPHPAGGLFAIPPPSNALVNSDTSDLVCQNIQLESHELFSQLCTVTNLVKVGPKRGLFMSCVGVGEGIMRVWRDWLKSNREAGVEGDGLLWADGRENVGLRVGVVENEVAVVQPVVGGWGNLGRNEDVGVSYTLQYEEVVVRTTQLLLKLEQSVSREINHSGNKTTVIGSWWD